MAKKELTIIDLVKQIDELTKRVLVLETNNIVAVSNKFEVWFDGKTRSFEYGPDLKKIVMPLTVGKTIPESRKIFFKERDKLVKEKYPGEKTPVWA